ncbi:LANO_0D06524g1_1 [Lachancea nothofagi CBS 11611]|uniref:LANO_0D06524g1_1 n=1 Tax=Lachancea nothofagi CBS 11611 TaxID=1266666 RepID=A0A1G4JHF4_9SACH|nr:LANO_0D06524g1_1 [Lachancea nothofagi CBS 11611]
MAQLQWTKTLAPLPATERNFSTKLSYDKHSKCVAYGCGKSAFVRSLDSDFQVQFTGHGTAKVTVVRFRPLAGSNYLCSGDDQGRVIVWSWLHDEDDRSNEAVTGTSTAIKSEFQVLSGPITDISWDMEGRRLCVVGEGRDKFGAFISWDTGNTLGELSGPSKRVNACHIKLSRPMRCFTAGDDGACVFFEGPPFRFAASDRTHHDQGKFIRDIKFSPGPGNYAVSIGSDRKIVSFDGRTGEFIKYVDDPEETIEGGFFALDWFDEGSESHKFATSSADAVIRVWDIESGKCINKWSLEKTLAHQQVGVATISENQVVSVSLDGALNIFEIGQHSPIKTIEGHNKGITALSTGPLASGSYDGRIVVWGSKGSQSAQMNNYQTNTIAAIDNENGIATTSWDNTMQVSGEVKHTFAHQPKIASPYKGSMAVVSVENELDIVSCDTGNVVTSKKLTSIASAVNLGTKYVAVGYEQSNTIELFHVSDLSVSFTLSTTMRATPSCLALSPSERFLAVGDVMGKILLFDLETKAVKTSRWAFHSGKITSMAWRPLNEEDEEEEDLIATASLDTHLMIYSVKKPMKNIKQLNAHKDGVTCVAWDGRSTIFSGGADSCIKEWKLILD